MTVAELRQDCLHRAVVGQSLTNYPTIYQGFIAKGIPPDDIKPRENVFTFNAWKALGRRVRKGEHGIKVITHRPIPEKKDESGKVIRPAGSMPWSTTVFHVTQTEPESGAGPAVPMAKPENLF